MVGNYPEFKILKSKKIIKKLGWSIEGCPWKGSKGDFQGVVHGLGVSVFNSPLLLFSFICFSPILV